MSPGDPCQRRIPPCLHERQFHAPCTATIEGGGICLCPSFVEAAAPVQNAPVSPVEARSGPIVQVTANG